MPENQQDTIAPASWGLKLQPENIPSALKSHKRWVVWTAKKRANGKVDKVPQIPMRGVNSLWSESSSWLTFEHAVNAYNEHPNSIDGIGFVMTGIKDDPLGAPLVAIDIDHCCSPEPVLLHPDALALTNQFDTYWEVSPSGTGLRGFVYGEIDANVADHEAGLEIYDGEAARFVTVTGQRYLSKISDVSLPEVHKADPEALASLVAKHRAKPSEKKETGLPMPDLLTLQRSDWDIIRPALGDDFANFLRGGTVPERFEESTGGSSRMIAATITRMYATLGALARQPGEEHMDALVLTILSESHAMVYAEAKRGSRAIEFLWQECQRCKPSLTAAADDFEEFFADAENFEATELPPGVVPASSWEGVEVEEREYLAAPLVPLNVVTILNGDGGVGKTLAAQDLATCVAAGQPWFGHDTLQGPALLFLCEDDAQELHRRQQALNAKYGLTYPKLADLYLWPRVGENNVLMSFDHAGNVRLAKEEGGPLHQLYAACKAVRPKLLVLDAAADLFGGNEIIRAQVRQFINALSKLAMKFEMAVVLLAHPSKSGLASGAGDSGSTAWNNTARSRLFLRRDKHNPQILVLETMKANYGPIGDQTRLLWRDGCLISEHEGAGDFFENRDNQIRDFFLECLDECTDVENGQALSPEYRAPSRYYVSRMLQMAKAHGLDYSEQDFKDAYNYLYGEHLIKLVESPTRAVRGQLILRDDSGDRGVTAA